MFRRETHAQFLQKKIEFFRHDAGYSYFETNFTHTEGPSVKYIKSLRNHISMNIARNVLHSRVTGRITCVYTRKRNHTSVNIARKVLHERALWQITYGDTQKRNPTSVDIA